MLAETVRATVNVEGVCRDQDDDMFLAAALSAHADYIVSGDRDLQALDEHEGVQVLSPRAFAELLEKGSPDER